MELKVMLKDEKEVQEFVQAASVCPEAIDLKSGAIYLDAKIPAWCYEHGDETRDAGTLQ